MMELLWDKQQLLASRYKERRMARDNRPNCCGTTDTPESEYEGAWLDARRVEEGEKEVVKAPGEAGGKSEEDFT
ncbi:hypothetical protein NDU88_009056 [Pleurodeles waltl]|uniref:Uncharacterized protein n=1 Tax=Pleurodeles waltl TaxID=8319 RepID=A0AAV7QWC7_PLEWA|nr:hypothetical protein NDU88_009056 [Pleurodeles waltl]